MMKANSIISFLGGLIVCASIMGVIYFAVALMTFDLAGGDTLQQMEGERAGWFILTIFLTGVSIYIAIEYKKKKRKFTAYGILSVAIIAFAFAAINCSKNIMNTPFNKQGWEKPGYKPYGMAATIVKMKSLNGRTKKEVLALLGTPDEAYEDKTVAFASLTYRVENDWTLRIYFKNDKVSDADMRLPGMMTIHAPLKMIHTV